MSRRRRGRGSVHGLLVVDKPAGPTSHDVVSMARRALDSHAVGHAGTLDPMATGVLVLAVGEATKLVPWLTADDKGYEATLRLGVSTTTLDREGAVVDEVAVPPGLDRSGVAAVAERFQGVFDQQAPAVSALKKDGVALHERVRRGERVEPPLRPVRVDRLDVEEVQGDLVRFRVSCGKGFYVRALARDLANALGTVGHLTELRRVRSGPFTVDGVTEGSSGPLPANPGRAMEVLAASATTARAGDSDSDAARSARTAARALVVPLSQAWVGRPWAVVDEAGQADARHGRAVARERVVRASPTVDRNLGPEPTAEDPATSTVPAASPRPPSDVPVALFDGDGRLLAVASSSGARGDFRIVRGFDPAASGEPGST